MLLSQERMNDRSSRDVLVFLHSGRLLTIASESSGCLSSAFGPLLYEVRPLIAHSFVRLLNRSL